MAHGLWRVEVDVEIADDQTVSARDTDHAGFRRRVHQTRILRALTLLATTAAAIATGVAPVMHALRHDLAQGLGAGGRDSGAKRSRLRSALLILQATLSVVLLVGAGLFVRSVLNVRRLRLGYDVDSVLVVEENYRGVKVTKAQQAALTDALASEAHALPGVVAATAAPSVPFWGFEGRSLFVAGIDSVSLLGDFTMQAGNAEYFRVMGTRILRGRGFQSADGAGMPRVTVVSAGMARALWPGQEALGKCLRISADTAPCTTVVGVAEDQHLHSLRDAHEYTYYVPIRQFDDAANVVLVRLDGDAGKYSDAIRRGLQRSMPGASYVTAIPLRAMVEPAMRSWRLGATMFVAFGGLALLLAAIGLYGVIAYGVAQRRREIGVRIALGASRSHVVSLVVRGGLRLVIAGIVLGDSIAAFAGKWSGSLLFNESPTDPAVFAGVAGLLLLVALIATALPASSAARVDPNITLRAD